jgi:hypothetical protein
VPWIPALCEQAGPKRFDRCFVGDVAFEEQRRFAHKSTRAST